MSKFRLHDWNDVRLLLACAENGSFAGAAAALGLDQSTVSRRIAWLEDAAGRPLFQRRRSGATPTPAGEALIGRARVLAESIKDFESAVGGVKVMPAPTITIAASEGVVTYLLVPALLDRTERELPLDRKHLKNPPPNLAFAALGAPADISILASDHGGFPAIQGAFRVRRIGTMAFVPVAGDSLLREAPPIKHFDDLRTRPLIDNRAYRGLKSMDVWNELVRARPPVLTGSSTSEIHQPLVSGRGYTLLPRYAPLFDRRVVVLDVLSPHLAADLWLVAHEDKLREPVIRELYDSLARMFLDSPWLRN